MKFVNETEFDLFKMMYGWIVKKFMKVIKPKWTHQPIRTKGCVTRSQWDFKDNECKLREKTLAAPSSRFVLVWHPIGRVSETMFLASHNLSGEVNRCNLKGEGGKGRYVSKETEVLRRLKYYMILWFLSTEFIIYWPTWRVSQADFRVLSPRQSEALQS